MTVTQILDALAPYTPEERRCSYKKKNKIDLRYRLMRQIWQMREDGMSDEDILNELIETSDKNRTEANMV